MAQASNHAEAHLILASTLNYHYKGHFGAYQSKVSFGSLDREVVIESFADLKMMAGNMDLAALENILSSLPLSFILGDL